MAAFPGQLSQEARPTASGAEKRLIGRADLNIAASDPAPWVFIATGRRPGDGYLLAALNAPVLAFNAAVLAADCSADAKLSLIELVPSMLA